MPTAANTPTSVYLDTFNKNPACKDDKKAVEKKCKPLPEQSEEDKRKGKPKPKRKGLGGKLAEAAEAFDDAGKLATGYKRDKASKTAFDGNAWMDDHCTGMWFSPTDTYDPAFHKKLDAMLDKLKGDKWSLLKGGFDELAEIAIDKAGDAAKNMATNYVLKSGAKAVVGAILGETVIVPILMAAWTVADLFVTAEKLAALAGDKGKAALDALKKINNIGDRTESILNSYKKEPHRAHADAMSLIAQLDPCLRARKCLLVPYKNAASDGTKDEEESAKRTAADPNGKKVRVPLSKAKSQAKHGAGCCPGQTGHHILPNAMVESANCPGYDYDNAPTMCLEGAKNGPTHGSHGMAHSALSEAMRTYKKQSGTDKLSYKDAKKHAIDAVQKAGALGCERKCLEAQLDAHYKCAGKELKADAGGGGGGKKAQPTVQTSNQNTR